MVGARLDGDAREQVRVYRLLESLQGAERAAALAALTALRDAPPRSREVALLARLGLVMDAVLRPQDVDPLDELDALVAAAEQQPALAAHALGLRAVLRARRGESELVIADAARGLALLDRPDLPPLDACTALVVCAAAYNALSLWELVDELYDRAAALEPHCAEPVQAAAVAMNRIVIRLEWASSLLEAGEPEAARQVLVRAAAAADVAATVARLPPLWQTAVVAARSALTLFLSPPAAPDAVLAQAAAAVAELRQGGDVEVLPLAESLTALALLALRRGQEAAAWLAREPAQSASSGARSFRLWVRAQVLDGTPSAGAAAYRDYAGLLAAQRRDVRRAVLAAARSRLADERTRAERDALAIDVALDPLTGLANRRAFDAWLGRKAAQPRLTALLLVDLDDFKAVNDGHGHAAGDEALRQVGSILARHVRPGDLAVRLGGDEFALILEAPGDHAPGSAAFEAIARSRAESLRAAVAAVRSAELGSSRLGASLGVAVALLPPAESAAAARLYRAADRALYADKAVRRPVPGR